MEWISCEELNPSTEAWVLVTDGKYKFEIARYWANEWFWAHRGCFSSPCNEIEGGRDFFKLEEIKFWTRLNPVRLK